MGLRPVLACLAICASGLAAAAPVSALTTRQDAALAQLALLDQQQAGYPGLMLGVWQRGNGGFFSATGVSNLRTGSPIVAGQRFRIGSNTKTFTATVILQLAERRQLRLSDHVNRFLRGIPDGGRVTIRELLDQTSGNPDLSNGFSKRILADPYREWNVRHLIISSLRRQPRVCPPGTCWHYSNVNYMTLGLIAQRASGEPFARLLEDGVLRPLHLRQTALAPSRPVPAPRADGYLYRRSGLTRDTVRWNFSWSFTAGAMTSTIADLRRYCPALATGKGLLSKATQRKRLRLVDISQIVSAPGAGYGLGVFALPTVAGTFIGHDGAVPGYDSLCLYSPQSRTTIVAVGTTSVELDPISPDRIPVSMLFTLVPAIAQVIAAG